eukprot:m.414253 g.414253  ORF g.414253 m.414253 type:complete len:443 (-) comp21268_c0_seq2:550-1878(-)
MGSPTRLIRGMRDILPELHDKFHFIGEVARKCASVAQYRQIETPILEFTDLFSRAIGQDTDIVSKEMYTFEDGNQREFVSLRPEGTAPIVRAAVRNYSTDLPQRFYYQGPMFRRERPQKGRYRQFTQFGVEHLGESHPCADVEAISLAHTILSRLQVRSETELRLNSLCDIETRSRHRRLLIEFLHANQKELSDLSKARLENGNVLRVLDSKDPGDQSCVQHAPSLLSVATPAAVDRFAEVCEGLDALGISYCVDHQLVRGLDYYSSSVWEFTTTRLGAQAAVLAGGRYDALAGVLGAKHDMAAVGWAAGIDRLALLMDECAVTPPRPPPVLWVTHALDHGSPVVSKDIKKQCLRLCHRLRSHGISVEYRYALGSLRKQLRAAQKNGACAVAVVGETELHTHSVIIKNMQTGAQESLSNTDDIVFPYVETLFAEYDTDYMRV